MGMNMDTMFPSRWLKGGDLQGRTVTVQIASIEMETFQDGTSKPAIFLAGKEKGVILNRTNAETLASAFGKDTDGWIGKTIELFSMRVQSPQGGMVDGLRIRVPQGAAPSPDEPAPAGDDLDDDIPF